MTKTSKLVTGGHTQVAAVGKVFSRAGEPEVILRNCSFDIQPGKLNVLIGPSGSGKSTLVNLIAGYTTPSVGEVVIDGKTVTGPGSDRMVVFQETALFPWMNLLDNVAFGPIQSGMARDEARKRAQELLKKVGLAGFEQRYPEQISGGMQRRAEVARALIKRPKVLLLDEPFRGLDHMSRGLMQEYFLQLFEDEGITTLFVTSEVDEAILLADRVIVLSYKPTAVKAILDVDLPRPRTFHMQTLPRFAELKEYTLQLLYEEAMKGFVQGTAASTEAGRLMVAQSAAH
ncbi:MAG TPA: ABC transporter ATP-binding protein [Burkholderiales bacterium]|jgi:ABC-type nitrate/sulfonate/bicarbonate transport system, ATPase component